MSNFMKISPIGAQLFHADGQTYMTKLTVFLLLGVELPLVVECFGLLNDIFPFPSILDTGYPVFNLNLANTLFDIILPPIHGSSL